MAALTADREAKKKAGNLHRYLLKASTTLYKGAIAMTDTNGLLVPGADTANYRFVGVAYEKAASGASGSTYCRVEKSGDFEFDCASADQTWVGLPVYAVDDHTVALAATTTNDVLVGYVTEYLSASLVRVRIDRAAQ